jgi:hypothetical protein
VLSSLAVIGSVISVVAASLGLGAIFYTVRENWSLLNMTRGST